MTPIFLVKEVIHALVHLIQDQVTRTKVLVTTGSLHLLTLRPPVSHRLQQVRHQVTKDRVTKLNVETIVVVTTVINDCNKSLNCSHYTALL